MLENMIGKIKKKIKNWEKYLNTDMIIKELVFSTYMWDW